MEGEGGKGHPPPRAAPLFPWRSSVGEKMGKELPFFCLSVPRGGEHAKRTPRKGSARFVLISTLHGKLWNLFWGRRKQREGEKSGARSLAESRGKPQAEGCENPWGAGRAGGPGSASPAGPAAGRARRGCAAHRGPLDVAGAVRIGLPLRGQAARAGGPAPLPARARLGSVQPREGTGGRRESLQRGSSGESRGSRGRGGFCGFLPRLVSGGREGVR